MAFAIALGCAGAGVDDDPDYTGMSEDDFSAMGGGDDHYLRDVVVRDSFNNTFLLHWPKRKMPLAVYLPPPPTGTPSARSTSTAATPIAAAGGGGY